MEADKGARLGLCVEAACRTDRAEPGLLLDILEHLLAATPSSSRRRAWWRSESRHAARYGGEIRLRFEVRDTGIGIYEDAQQRIFVASVQAGPEIAPRFGGSGLGLAIARRRLEARGGRIGVESAPGRGAMFWFELTVERDAAAPSAAESATAALRLDALGGGGRRQRREPACVVAPEPYNTLKMRRLPGRPRGRGRPDRQRAKNDGAAETVGERGAGTRSNRETRSPRPTAEKILLAEDNGVNRRILAAMLTGGGLELPVSRTAMWCSTRC